MNDGAEFSIEEGERGQRLVLRGAYLVSTIGAIDQDLRALVGPYAAIDLSGVEEIDTVGAWVVMDLARVTSSEVVGASNRAKRLMGALHGIAEEAKELPEQPPFFQQVFATVGEKVFAGFDGVLYALSFLGGFVMAMGSLLRHPSRFRVTALVRQFELVGVNALGIIGLMSFLIGIVIAQQGAVQLEQFGAESLTVNLVGRITLRELGVLMTAIMVAGRSGSAFAAQLGTMKLTEEIDAMRTIGISPMEALIVPRVMAVTLMMVLLGFYSSVVAIIGGATVSDVSLGMPFTTFLIRIKEVVPITDFYVGMIKAPVFGLIVGLTGCFQGMQVEGNSEDVGRRTTKAVVIGIFVVIVLDAFFAVFFTQIGWS
ncbi:MlaE family ABC transporter permease [Tsuneonella mangrovi]|uniref:MlaE family ABC transporter permease n=1 Tax=Tsuneonella mangrovi TaxID=1982042 RepID=UPI000BA22525|nr:ABC transporter permease [Tsuneonella mangrovi]